MQLPLHKRIEWLRKQAGSHDKLAARLGTKRQTVIGWEKGAQPNGRYRQLLAELSGFPADAFARTASEREVWALTEARLRAVEESLAETRRDLEQKVEEVTRLATRAMELIRAIEQSLRDQPPRPGGSLPPGGVDEDPSSVAPF